MPDKEDFLTQIAVERVAFGLRFQPHYEVLDNIGAIIDRVLRSEGSPFGPSTFPLSTRETAYHSLINPENGDELRLTHSDAILEMQIKTKERAKIENLAAHFETFIINTLREKAHLDDIVRYGIIFRLEECRAEFRETPVEHFLHHDFPDASSLSLRFTKRLPVEEALARRDVDDYRNVIYTVKQKEEGEIGVWVDYQQYFKPELKGREWARKPFSEFVDRGIGYFMAEFQNWLRKFGLERRGSVNGQAKPSATKGPEGAAKLL